MARIRSIKPVFFRHAGLFDAERESKLPLRVAFAGLWTAADREGRFAWEPRTLKLDCLPFDDVDFAEVLCALERHGFVKKYVVDGKEYGFIPSWHEHQLINQREAQSRLPDPSRADTCMHVHTRGEGKGKEGKGKEEVVDAPTARDDESVPRETSPPAPIESPKGLPRKYAFEGSIIRLTEADYRDWENAFKRLDLRAELIARDAWLATSAKDRDRENWWQSTPKYLANRNAEARAKNQNFKWASGIEGVY